MAKRFEETPTRHSADEAMVRFSKGKMKITLDDWDHADDYSGSNDHHDKLRLDEAQTRRLFEAMREYYEGASQPGD